MLNRPVENNRTIEFVLIMALLTALNPLSLDAILPALSDIGHSLKVAHGNDVQLIISSMIFGMVFGEFIFGPLSDSFGRKRIILIGMGIYSLGTLLAFTSQSIEQLIIGRVIQGLGVSGPKIATRAMIRDSYSGDEMARILSLILMVVIFIPMVAPAYGQLLLNVFSWRSIFISLLVVSLLAGAWLGLRQTETLPITKRHSFSYAMLKRSFVELTQHRQFMCCTTIAGLIFGMQLLFLSIAPQIFRDLYSVDKLFAFYFGVLACSLAIALLTNSKLVIKFGMQRMIKIALLCLSLTGLGLLALTILNNGKPSFSIFLLFSFLQFFGMGIVFGNINALAMKPMGHIAGFGSSVIASLSSLIAILVAIPIGRFYSDSIMPLALGFTLLPVAGYVLFQSVFRKETLETSGSI